MLIQSLEQKTRLAMMTVIAAISGCVVICGFTLWCCMSLVTKEREQIYILDGDIPFWRNVRSWKPTSRWRLRRISSSFISISSICHPITTISSGRSARRCIWRTGRHSNRNRRWTRTGFIPTSFPRRRSVPSCATPSTLTSMNGSSPITVRSLSSGAPGT